jgi:hypothetical protein
MAWTSIRALDGYDSDDVIKNEFDPVKQALFGTFMKPIEKQKDEFKAKETAENKLAHKDDVEVYKFFFNLLLGEKLPEQRLKETVLKLNKRMLSKEY